MKASAPSLAGRLRSTLLAVGAVQLVIVVAALALFTSMREHQEQLTQTYFSTIQDSNRGFTNVLALEQSAASYVRTGDAEELARYRELRQPRPDAVPAEELRRRLSGSPQAIAALDAVVESATTWLPTVETLVAKVEEGGRDAVRPAERAQQLAAFRVVEESYDTYLTEVLASRTRALERLETRTSLLFAVVLLAVAAAVVTGLVLYAALRRWVTVPIARLADETRQVRRGALEHAVHVAGPPEIVALGDDIETMRQGLVEQLAELERAQAAVERQAEELRRSNRDLEQFAYVASHDLQEPLRKVSSFCQMLERRYQGQLDERADQYIAFAVDGAKRMQQLINDLLMFSRVGRLTDGFAEVSLDDVLAEALRNLQTAVEESGAVVTADPLPVLRGERRLLVQLFQNLLGNALKFRGEDPPRVRIEAVDRDDAWELSVSDNGIGVQPQYAERIFVIFQRLHAKADYEGTGIGLSLCKRIVEHHGGAIWLDADAGPGAVFRWTLPKQAPAPLPDDEAPAGAEKEVAWTATPR